MRAERIAVIGAGAWGTALAQAAAAAGRSVVIGARDGETVEEINTLHSNRRYLPDVALLPAIRAASPAEAAAGADVIVMAVPAQATRAALEALPPETLMDRPVILSAKGLEHGTLLRQSEVLHAVAPRAVPFVLSGPSFAADVAAGRPTAVTLAGDDASDTSALAAAIAGPALRPYAADDRVGVELAGALKNVYALACGAVEGAGLGASARSALLARAFSELTRIVTAMGGSASTLTGLAGLGDLTLTCTSMQSRNYRFGLALGRGLSAVEVGASGIGLAEGVATAPVARSLARELDIDAPLVGAVNQVLEGSAAIGEIVAGLMSRPLKRED